MLEFNNYGSIIGKYSLKKKELFLDDFSSREPLSLYKRALASLLNKVFIFLLFITMCLIVFGAFTAPGDLGTYTVVLGVQPGKYDIIPSGDLMHAIDIKYTILSKYFV